MTLHIDGQEVCRYEDPSPLPPGYIGLQLNEGPVQFRDIRLRPLGATPIFNGRDLTGWSTALARESRFGVTDAGELLVESGSGQIESEGRYGDFIAVAGDPLADVRALEDVAVVVKGGEVAKDARQSR